ncbi:endonuclease/exonuclease/phosphatase family protein [Clostridium taeniosporum]|uniref:Endonuclease n=1 Tax=Clostridium taeniosporum TaxID=394958 RepID=A0A1D7XGJ4_9CLOT|nr:endonuclease/exonuclease/phosphatase family protein [Clostridium taeniosporum]AOR22483.1 endonuclease [Clostridium taeniosporum]
MKLLTLNCHSWQEENQLDKIKYLAKTIVEKDYDAIALQEVSQSIDAKIINGNLKADNFALLLKYELDKYDTSYNFFWDFSHIGYGKYQEGLAIFTKHNIINEKSFFITKATNIQYWKTRKIVKITFKYKNKNIDFYSCHLGWWDDEEEPFENQVEKLLQENTSDKIIFFMGDFNNNAFIRNEGYDYLLSKGLVDTFKISKECDNGITVKGKIDGWDENKEKLRLDLILSNKKLDVLTSRVIFNGINKDVISDHYGVEVSLNL